MAARCNPDFRILWSYQVCRWFPLSRILCLEFGLDPGRVSVISDMKIQFENNQQTWGITWIQLNSLKEEIRHFYSAASIVLFLQL